MMAHSGYDPDHSPIEVIQKYDKRLTESFLTATQPETLGIIQNAIDELQDSFDEFLRHGFQAQDAGVHRSIYNFLRHLSSRVDFMQAEFIKFQKNFMAADEDYSIDALKNFEMMRDGLAETPDIIHNLLDVLEEVYPDLKPSPKPDDPEPY